MAKSSVDDRQMKAFIQTCTHLVNLNFELCRELTSSAVKSNSVLEKHFDSFEFVSLQQVSEKVLTTLVPSCSLFFYIHETKFYRNVSFRMESQERLDIGRCYMSRTHSM